MSDIFGQSNYGGNYTKKNYWKLKDGESVFRILPALGELAKEGRWSVFWKVHYGYKNTKGQLRTFESPLIKNNKTKMVEVPDAALERIETLKAGLEKAKQEGNKEMTAQLDKFVGQKGMYNLDSNHYMNVMDKAGNIGILKIRHRAKVALDATIKKLRDKGVDPLSPDNGRFFVFSRSGMGLDTTFQVEVLKEKVQVDGMGELERDMVHKLTPEVANRCAISMSDGSFRYVEAANLLTLYKKPTSEEVAQIVKESDIKTGNSPAVDRILDTKAASSPDASTEEDAGSDYEEPKQAVITPVAAKAPVVIAPVAAAVAAPAVAAPAVVAPAVVAPKAQAVVAAAVESDAAFLASLGLA